ncbi:oxidoreductase [Candidatus Termititenax persephonae]|uniref:Oxidoreductase n=1 Tax=Candidatus Termititenax persephonae TaxID=2218525 RepID=A0A388TEP6_9BACT|nr:oxidoreductase [Candidatus Termititenax persephonae]
MYNVLIIGAGQIASGLDFPNSLEVLTHAHAVLKQSRFNLLGFYDVDFAKANQAAQKWQVNAYTSLPKADVIVIATPDKIHLENVRQAATAHPRLIILEKPLAADLADARAITKLAKKIPMQVNFTRRFVPELQKLALEIRKGKHGRLQTGSGFYGKGFIHNGSHLVDLLKFFGLQIKCVQGLNNFVDFYKHDPTKTVRLILPRGGEFFMQGVDCQNYTVFELDLFFEKARIRIVNSGAEVEIYGLTNSKKYRGYKFLNLDNKCKTQLDCALPNLYNNVYDFLVGKGKLLASVQDVFTEILYA